MRYDYRRNMIRAWDTMWGEGREELYPVGIIQINPAVTRRVVNDRREFLMMTKIPIELACTIFTATQRESCMYDRIVLDIDTVNTDIWRMALEKISHSGVPDDAIQLVWTGKKGCHVWIRIEPMYLESYRESVLDWCSNFNLIQHVDIQVLEPHRVIRMPYTWRMDTGEMCRPIILNEYGWQDISVDDIAMTEAADMKGKLRNGLKPKYKAYKPMHHTESSGTAPVDPNLMPKCVSQIYYHCIMGGDLRYVEYFMLGTWLAAVTTMESYLGVLSKCGNYDEGEAIKHYHYWRDRGTRPYGCDRIIQEGKCPGKCSVYPKINRWINQINYVNSLDGNKSKPVSS